MSDESYSPDSNSSYDENEYKLLHCASKNHRTVLTPLNRKCYFTNEKKIILSPRNNSHSRPDLCSPVRGLINVECRSRSAVKLLSTVTSSKETKYVEKNVQLIDMDHFQNEMNQAHVCPNARLLFFYDTKPAVGLFHQHTFECTKCQTRTNFSNFTMKHPVRSTLQEPNARLYAAAAITGAGYEEISTIMSLLCLSITTKKHFLEQTHRIYSNLHMFAQKEFEPIIDYIKQSFNTNNSNSDSILDICVSLDGTWKKRGHVSNYGIVFLIHVDSGYCIDYEVMSLFCEVCEMKKTQLSPKAFQRWFISHKKDCFKNYDGTSKGMEVEGALRIFKRSLAKGLRYKWLVCDGDSSAYDAVKNFYLEGWRRNTNQSIKNQMYNHRTELVVEKFNCINHVKKRVISRLKDIKSKNTGYQQIASIVTHTSTTKNKLPSKAEQITTTTKKVISSKINQAEQAGARTDTILSSKVGQPKDSTKLSQLCRARKLLSDGKPFGGSSGRMTDAIMKKISDMYGLAIRQGISEGQKHADNPSDLVDRIQRKCLAAFYHFINLENKEEQHSYCPTGALSWCSYQRDKVTHKHEDMAKSKSRLDPVFLSLLQKMINDLTSKELLHRCMHGLTQNSNESINSVIWSVLSKSKHHGFISIRGAAAISSVYFNSGRKSLLNFFQQCDIHVNQQLYFNFLAKDEKRIQRAERSATRREQIISHKSMLREKSMKAENDKTQYASGSFY